MPDRTELTVLLIDDDAGDVALLRDQLSTLTPEAPIRIESFGRLASALTRLAHNGVDVVLLGLNLPDAPGLTAVERLCAEAPLTPVVVMATTDDEATLLAAVRYGAQDALVKGHVDARLIGRALRFALERKRSEQALARVASVMAGLCYECGRKLAPDRPHVSHN